MRIFQVRIFPIHGLHLSLLKSIQYYFNITSMSLQQLLQRYFNLDSATVKWIRYRALYITWISLLIEWRHLKLVSAFHNNSRLWGLSGWKPVELARMTLSRGLPAISFGPGLQKAFADGTMNKEELIEGIRKLGLDVIE